MILDGKSRSPFSRIGVDKKIHTNSSAKISPGRKKTNKNLQRIKEALMSIYSVFEGYTLKKGNNTCISHRSL
jgi:hypothetical protein